MRKAHTHYKSTSSGGDSTKFAKTLYTGRGLPEMLYPDGTVGPALSFEIEYEGTLEWLISPFWDVVDAVNQPSLRHVFSYMFTLFNKAEHPLVNIIDGEFHRTESSIDEQLFELKRIGNLNSLAGLILLAAESFCLCRHKQHQKILDFFSTHQDNWNCLQWMPPLLRRCICNLIGQRILMCSPADLSEVTVIDYVNERTILRSSNGESFFEKATEADWAVFNSLLDKDLGSTHHKNSDCTLPRQTVQTFMTEVIPWLDVMSNQKNL